MTDFADSHRHWEVRPTLRLSGIPASSPPDQTLLDRVADALRQHPSVAFAAVGCVIGLHSAAITATIQFAQPLSLGAAVEEATKLLEQSGAAAGLMPDVVVEVVAEPGGVDPRALL